MIVLQYIYSRSERFQTFVANRLFVIPDGSVPNQWRKVGTKENPADDVSRGLSGFEMVSSDRWKRVLKECMMRRKLRGNPQVQRMADLPFDRVTPGKPPFSFVGVDCFGPFVVKTGRTQIKRYGCLFTCLTTRAVHIEKLDSLEADSFINGFVRFCAKRGVPEKSRSDNGTNFVAGEKELREAMRRNME